MTQGPASALIIHKLRELTILLQVHRISRHYQLLTTHHQIEHGESFLVINNNMSVAPEQQALLEKDRLIASFGVFHFSDRERAENHQKDWDLFLDKIRQEPITELCILGATGQETFLDEMTAER